MRSQLTHSSNEAKPMICW